MLTIDAMHCVSGPIPFADEPILGGERSVEEMVHFGTIYAFVTLHLYTHLNSWTLLQPPAQTESLGNQHSLMDNWRLPLNEVRIGS